MIFDYFVDRNRFISQNTFVIIYMCRMGRLRWTTRWALTSESCWDDLAKRSCQSSYWGSACVRRLPYSFYRFICLLQSVGRRL